MVKWAAQWKEQSNVHQVCDKQSERSNVPVWEFRKRVSEQDYWFRHNCVVGSFQKVN